jgi:hypothetical protein
MAGFHAIDGARIPSMIRSLPPSTFAMDLKWGFSLIRGTTRSAEIGPKTGPTLTRRPALATARERQNPRHSRDSRSGASRTRTGDLLGAIHFGGGAEGRGWPGNVVLEPNRVGAGDREGRLMFPGCSLSVPRMPRQGPHLAASPAAAVTVPREPGWEVQDLATFATAYSPARPDGRGPYRLRRGSPEDDYVRAAMVGDRVLCLGGLVRLGRAGARWLTIYAPLCLALGVKP